MAAFNGVSIFGRRVVRPGGFVRWIALPFKASVDENAVGVVGLIAPADGGKPGVVLEFSSPEDAEAVLRGGDGLRALKLTFTPGGRNPDGSEVRGASLVRFVRVDPATPATLTVAGASGTAGTLTTKQYGVRANLAWASLAASGGLYTLHLEDEDLDALAEATFNGETLEITYTGAGTAASVQVLDVSGVRHLRLVVDSVTVADFDLTDLRYNTLLGLQQAIDALADFSATLLRSPQFESARLDRGTVNFSGTPKKAKPLALWADFADVVAGFGIIADFTLTDDSVGAPVAFAKTYFTGGGTSSPTLADWEAARTALGDVEAGIVVPVTTDLTQIDATVAWGNARSEPLVGKRRIVVAGYPWTNQSASVLYNDVRNYVRSKSEHRFALVASGLERIDPLLNKRVLLRPHVVAALVAGRMAGQAANLSLTRRTVSGQPQPLWNSGQIDQLLLDGVIVLDQNGVEAEIVQGISTYKGDDNRVYRNLQGTRVMDAMSNATAAIINGYIGLPASAGNVGRLRDELADYYTKRERDGWITEGYDADGVFHKAFENLRIRTDGGGRIVGVSVTLHPTLEIEYAYLDQTASPVELVI